MVLRISQSPSITGTSPSDCFVSYPGHSLGGSYPSAEMQSVYSTAPADLGKHRFRDSESKSDIYNIWHAHLHEHHLYQRNWVKISPILELLLAGQRLTTQEKMVSVKGIKELSGNISLALASRNLKESQWETVLPEALHFIRSLYCY